MMPPKSRIWLTLSLQEQSELDVSTEQSTGKTSTRPLVLNDSDEEDSAAGTSGQV